MRIFFYLLLVILLACSSHQEVEVKDDSGQIVERFTVDKKTGKKNGEYHRLDGQLITETALYVNDTLDGVRTLYFKNGQKEIEETYKMGIYHGDYFTYYEDGRIKQEGQYVDGTMEGPWKKYYNGGELMEMVEMHDNNENGPFIEYWENGNLKAEGTYLDGDNEDGELKLYSENGELEKIMQCNRGICHTTWKREAGDL